ncbi:hypothetical protein [Psychrobacter sp. GP33]|uniref:hypothetical protein n=1 Tax=Psychrobacter sp. GP33 TaxID=2758709 RepID=UPI0015FD2181|nr:hypothetical protein [Psychrobacter sp. GP33]
MCTPTGQKITQHQHAWLIPFACLIGLTALAFLFCAITGTAFLLTTVTLPYLFTGSTDGLDAAIYSYCHTSVYLCRAVPTIIFITKNKQSNFVKFAWYRLVGGRCTYCYFSTRRASTGLTAAWRVSYWAGSIFCHLGRDTDKRSVNLKLHYYILENSLAN